jgi:hypothetical protein
MENKNKERFRSLLTNVYLLIGWIALLVVFMLLGQSARRKAAAGHHVPAFMERLYLWGMALSVVGALSGLAVLLWGSFTGDSERGAGKIVLKHVHGLAYSVDGHRLLVSSHRGLSVYEQGQWRSPSPAAPQHHYMGLSMADDGYYSSGRPGRGSSLKDPLGIVKIGADEQSIQILALHGQADIHEMTVGLRTHAIYAVVHEPNSRMAEPGLYYSLDDAKTWTKSRVAGLKGGAFTMAAHPDQEGIVAVGNQNGTFLSYDYGNTFELISGDAQTSALTFMAGGELIIAGVTGNEDEGELLVPTLYKLDLGNKQAESMGIPDLGGEPIQYIVQNPRRDGEFALSTFKRDIYVSNDGGAEWKRIAEYGKALDEPFINQSAAPQPKQIRIISEHSMNELIE